MLTHYRPCSYKFEGQCKLFVHYLVTYFHMVSLYDFCQVFYYILSVHNFHLSHLVSMCVCGYCMCVVYAQWQSLLVFVYTFELLSSQDIFDEDNSSLFMAIQTMFTIAIEISYILLDHGEFLRWFSRLQYLHSILLYDL